MSSGSRFPVPIFGVGHDDHGWRTDAACADTYETMFDPAEIETAMKLCAGCPVAEACDSYAAATRPTAGVWAGIHSDDRGKEQRKQSRLARLSTA